MIFRSIKQMQMGQLNLNSVRNWNILLRFGHSQPDASMTDSQRLSMKVFIRKFQKSYGARFELIHHTIYLQYKYPYRHVPDS